MERRWWAQAGVIFAGGVLGTAARVGLLGLLGHDIAALAAVNLLGCLLLGCLSGVMGQRASLLRSFLAVGGLGAFTSWSSLAMQGVTGGAWAVVVVIAETALGVIAAGLGHLAGRRLGGGGR